MRRRPDRRKKLCLQFTCIAVLFFFGVNTVQAQIKIYGDPPDAYEGQQYGFTFSLNARAGSVSLSPSNTWLSAKLSASGYGVNISGKAGAVKSYNYTVTVVSDDGTVNVDNKSFDIVVKRNNPPSFTSSPPKSAKENQTYTYNMTASDPDGHSVSLSAVRKPSFLTFSSSGTGKATLSGKPGYSDAGSYTIELRATDISETTNNSDTQTYTLTVSNTNRTPIFSSSPVTSGKEGQSYSYRITGSDPDGNSLTFSVDQKPSFLTLKNNGDGTVDLSGTPGYDKSGSYTVKLRVSDGSASSAQNFTLNISNTNQPPMIASTPVTEGAEGEAYQYVFNAIDEDGRPITYSVSLQNGNSLPGWLNVQNAAGSGKVLSGTPGFVDAGTYEIRISASDDGDPSLTGTQDFTLSIANTNRPPEFISAAVTNATENAEYTYDITTNDDDGDEVTLSLEVAPPFLNLTSIDPAAGTATLEGTPGPLDGGTYNIELRATDGLVNNDQSFVMTVEDLNSGPEFTSTPPSGVGLNQQYRYLITTSDPNGQNVNISLTKAPSFLELKDIDSRAGTATLEGIPQSGDEGTYTIKLQALYNGDQTQSTNQQFQLTVSATNKAPVIVSEPFTSAAIKAEYRYEITVTDSADISVDSVAISAVLKGGDSLPAWLSLGEPASPEPGVFLRTLSGTPSATDRGQYEIVITSLDDAEEALESTQRFILTVSGKNRPPVFLNLAASVNAIAGVPYEYRMQAHDPDSNVVRLSMAVKDGSKLPGWLNLSEDEEGEGWMLSATPDEEDIGRYLLVLTATDDGSPAESEEQTIMLEVQHNITELKALFNYPNPFQRETKIKFELPEEDNVYLEVYSAAGNRVWKSSTALYEPGTREIDFQPRELPSGIYIYRIVSSKANTTGRLTIIR